MKNGSQFKLCLASCALGLLLLAGAANAQEQTQIQLNTPPPPPSTPDEPVQLQVDTSSAPVEPAGLDVREGAILLSLDEAVEVALRQNLGVAIQRYTRQRTRLGVDQSLGRYDLLASALAYAEDLNTATISEFESSESNRQRLNFTVEQLIPAGGVVSVGFTNMRSENNNIFQRINPGYNSSFEFAFRQPLLRNFGRLATELEILVAHNRSQASREEFERQLTTTVQDVINAYWNLVGARRQLIVAQESLSLARELHDRNRIQVEVGTMAPLELVQSEAAIAEREEGIITAQGLLGDAEDQLRRLLNLPEGELWSTEIRPVTDPTIQHTPIDIQAAIQTAFAERPEMRAQALDVEQARLEAAFAQNQVRPTLDLDVSYGYGGAGGNAVIRDEDTGEIIDTLPGDYFDAFNQITGLSFPSWTAQLTFGYPLQNRGARAAKAIADIDLERAETAMEDLRKAIITEVRAAARQVETAAKQIDAAKASRVFQERNLDAERKRYENGMSTSFQITQIQEDVTEARRREVFAVNNYRRVLADYYRSIGRLLEEEGVTIQDEEAEIDRWQFSLSGK